MRIVASREDLYAPIAIVASSLGLVCNVPSPATVLQTDDASIRFRACVPAAPSVWLLPAVLPTGSTIV